MSQTMRGGDLLEQHAVVLKTDGQRAWVEARESGTCGSCGPSGCSTRRLADLFGVKQRAFPVENTLRAASGELVVIGIPAGALWKSALGLYGVPLLSLFAGAMVGQCMGGDGGAALGMAVGLMAGALACRTGLSLPGWRPVMLRKELGLQIHRS